MAEIESAAARAKRRKQEERIFLVVIDNSEEMRVALRYAGLRAKATGGAPGNVKRRPGPPKVAK